MLRNIYVQICNTDQDAVDDNHSAHKTCDNIKSQHVVLAKHFFWTSKHYFGWVKLIDAHNDRNWKSKNTCMQHSFYGWLNRIVCTYIVTYMHTISQFLNC